MMKREKVITMISMAALVGAVGVGGTLAYFTDSKEVSNIVTMGYVDISLYETDSKEGAVVITEEGLTFDRVMPGDVLRKDPSVKLNEGSADAYIRVKVNIVPAKDASLTKEELAELSASIQKDVEAGGSWYYNPQGGYYYYREVMTEESAPAVLFDTVTIPAAWGNNTANQSFTIEVEAEAIQADNFEPVVDEQSKLVTGWGEELSDGLGI